MDVFGLTNKPQFNWVFHSNGTTNSWQTWQKPPNCKFVYFFLLGGGAGGNRGVSGVGVNRQGGAGGGASSITRGLFPAMVLPDILYIQVGLGGAGGVAGSAGAGSLSYVCIEPITSNIADVLLISGTAAAAAGTPIAVAGAAGTVFTQTSALPNYLGLITLSVGAVGANGGSYGGGSNITPTTIVTGGAGGAGSTSVNVNSNGGSIFASTVTQQINGGLAGAGVTADNGIFTQLPSIDTSSTILPMAFTGGAGGGSNGNGNGGNGGNGSYGCGGGGGGAGTAAGTGGRGGDGLVIITAW